LRLSHPSASLIPETSGPDHLVDLREPSVGGMPTGGFL
jgi:hypothetical protein